MKEIVRNVITIHVNGKTYDIPVGPGRYEMPESETLSHTLRDRLGLTGLKIGCDQGACGCCTVIMDGKAVTSCMTLTSGQLRIPVRILYAGDYHDGQGVS